MMHDQTGAIERELDRLRALGKVELQGEWRRLRQADVPRISRDLLVLGLAHKLQAGEHGDLGKAARRKLRAIAKSLREAGHVGSTPILGLAPGTQLVREWHGRTYLVTVTQEGFEYDGTTHASLTTIAKRITGAHWSGPRFFGLLEKAAKGGQGAGSDG